MKTPFTTEQFFEVFQKYNTEIYPLQLIIIVLGIAAIFLIHIKKNIGSKIICGFLSFLWMWIGIVYHLSFFTEINKAAFGFGGLFVLQGIFFFIELFRNKLHFSFKSTASNFIGYFFILFGLIIYPTISYLSAQTLPETISLGLPCPTTIFTFGFLMLANKTMSKYLLIIPSIWAVIGTIAAVNFGIYQDYVMLLSAIVADIYTLRRRN
jgi:hypothetical protein